MQRISPIEPFDLALHSILDLTNISLAGCSINLLEATGQDFSNLDSSLCQNISSLLDDDSKLPSELTGTQISSIMQLVRNVDISHIRLKKSLEEAVNSHPPSSAVMLYDQIEQFCINKYYNLHINADSPNSMSNSIMAMNDCQHQSSVSMVHSPEPNLSVQPLPTPKSEVWYRELPCIEINSLSPYRETASIDDINSDVLDSESLTKPKEIGPKIKLVLRPSHKVNTQGLTSSSVSSLEHVDIPLTKIRLKSKLKDEKKLDTHINQDCTLQQLLEFSPHQTERLRVVFQKCLVSSTIFTISAFDDLDKPAVAKFLIDCFNNSNGLKDKTVALETLAIMAKLCCSEGEVNGFTCDFPSHFVHYLEMTNLLWKDMMGGDLSVENLNALTLTTDQICAGILKYVMDSISLTSICSSGLRIMEAPTIPKVVKLSIINLLSRLFSNNNELQAFILEELCNMNSWNDPANIFQYNSRFMTKCNLRWESLLLICIFQYFIIANPNGYAEFSLLVTPCLEKISQRSTLMSKFEGTNPLVLLITDILALVSFPEWPISILLLKCAVIFLLRMVSENATAPDLQIRLKAYELLGNIGSVLRPLLYKHDDPSQQLTEMKDYLESLDYISPFNILEIKKIYIILNSNGEAPNQAMLKKNLCIRTILVDELKSQLGPLSDKILIVLLKTLTSPTINIRLRGIKSLGIMIDGNDPMLLNRTFMDAVKLRLNDPSPVVRDAVLEFLVRTLGIECLISEDYFVHFAEKMVDSALLVRRRCVKLARDLLCTKIDLEMEAKLIGLLIIRTVSDESSIANLALQILNENWLDKFIQNTGTDTASDRQDDREVVGLFASCVIKVIKFLENSSTSLLQGYFELVIKERQRREHVKRLCLNVIDVLFETLVSAVEKSNLQIVSHILGAIIVFTSYDYSNLEHHLRLLSQLVLSSSDMETVEKSLLLLSLGIPRVSRSSLASIAEVPKEITLRILKGSENYVKYGIEIMYNMAKLYSNDFEGLTFLWERLRIFLDSMLAKYPDPATISKELLPPIGRALFSLGCLSRYSCFECIDFKLTGSVQKAIEIFTLYYYRNYHPSITACSIRALGNVTAEIPMLVLERDLSELMHHALTLNVATSRLAALRVLYDILTKEVEAGQDNFSSVNIDENLDAKPSICSNILQNFIQDIILAILETNNVDAIYMGMELIETALFQRLCHPYQIIPVLIALSTSPIPRIRDRATGICEVVYEKFASFAWSNLGKVLLCVYSHHKSVNGGMMMMVLGMVQDENSLLYTSIFEKFYLELCAKKNKRKDFLLSVIFELETFNDVNYGVFLGEGIAMLPFKTQEEVCLVLSKIHDWIAFTADSLVDSSGGGDGDGNRNGELAIMKLYIHLQVCRYLCKAFGMNIEKLESVVGNRKINCKEKVCVKRLDVCINLRPLNYKLEDYLGEIKVMLAEEDVEEKKREGPKREETDYKSFAIIEPEGKKISARNLPSVSTSSSHKQDKRKRPVSQVQLRRKRKKARRIEDSDSSSDAFSDDCCYA